MLHVTLGCDAPLPASTSGTASYIW
jgi:hypothetical protein